MLIKLIDELISSPKETEWLEFKSGNATENNVLGHYISGISNAACIHGKDSGYLVFGISDDNHEVVGTSYRFGNRKQGGEELGFWIRRHLSPSIMFQHHICEYNELHIELFIIPAAKGEPTLFQQTPYLRLGTSLKNIRCSEYSQYLRAIYNSAYDWSAKIVDGATIDDLDIDALNKARDKFFGKNKDKTFYAEIEDCSNEVFLDKAKITIGGKITNTAIILLGKPESSNFISPAVAQITWKLDTEEKAYEHFEIPLFTSINNVLNRIRNMKYKFFPDNQLNSIEVDKYNTKVILEALNNCIAHQDYSCNSRITLVEQLHKLVFTNAGNFFDGDVEEYIHGNKTPEKYRNQWLANAMVCLDMIDTAGYGINRMYKLQRERFFPLPDYTNSVNGKVVLEIYGHSINENYSKLLIEKNDNLTLTEVILLDKIQKRQNITEDAVKKLRSKKLIEGKKPNYYVSLGIAGATNQKVSYTKHKGLDKESYKHFVIQHISLHGSASRNEIDEIISDKLPDLMTEKQRKIKINNLLQEMVKEGSIKNTGTRTKPTWILL